MLCAILITEHDITLRAANCWQIFNLKIVEMRQKQKKNTYTCTLSKTKPKIFLTLWYYERKTLYCVCLYVMGCNISKYIYIFPYVHKLTKYQC